MGFDLPKQRPSIIKVVGVGGGGSNAVNYMYDHDLKDVEFVICNTDIQALENSRIPLKIQLGQTLTSGLGAGNKPEVGRESAVENLMEIEEMLQGSTKMVFITAGMGGGTGTGAAPVIAQKAKEMGLLTVGIVTIPFLFEGEKRVSQALDGVERMQEHVDALLVISNQKLREIYGDLKLSNAFSKADDVLSTATKGIAEIITLTGYINVDFADVETVMKNSGVAIMGMGRAKGENRSVDAIKQALQSPLLNNNDIDGARNILLNITSGANEVTMDEIGQITDYVQSAVGDKASIIWGTGNDETLDDSVNVTIIATGFSETSIPEMVKKQENKRRTLVLDDDEEDLFGVKPSVVEQGAGASSNQSGLPANNLFDLTDTEDDFFRTKDRDSSFKKNDIKKDVFDSQERSNSSAGEVVDEHADQHSEPVELELRREYNFTEHDRKKDIRKEVFYGSKETAHDAYKPKVEGEVPIGLKNQLSTEDMENEKLVELLEKVPAYKRSNFKAANKTEPHSISNFTLDEGSDGISLTDDNPYLHNIVD